MILLIFFWFVGWYWKMSIASIFVNDRSQIFIFFGIYSAQQYMLLQWEILKTKTNWDVFRYDRQRNFINSQCDIFNFLGSWICESITITARLDDIRRKFIGARTVFFHSLELAILSNVIAFNMYDAIWILYVICLNVCCMYNM